MTVTTPALALDNGQAAAAPARATARHLEMLTDLLDGGVLILDGAREIVHCNDAFGALFDMTATEIRSLHIEDVFGRIQALAVSPPTLSRSLDRGTEVRTICHEFEMRAPRSVIRWLSRTYTTPERAEVIVCTDITTEVDLASAYQHLAVTDALTGLSNRRGIDQHIRREVARVVRHGYRLSFAMLDIDHFKRVNDRFGHGMGDEVLRRVSSALAKTLRASDMAARWGGEEFLIVLTDTGIEGARLCAERIRVAVEALDIPRVGSITISAGTAELLRGEDLSITLLRADELLYKAKAAGRNCVRG
jgi:diguanylate cyclase (GGDEF)-like protein